MSMHIIDAFCGIGPWAMRDPLLPYRPEEILPLLDHFGIARALVFPSAARQWGAAPAVNEIVREAACLSDRFLPAFSLAAHVYADCPTPQDYLAAMREAGARAAWYFPPAHAPLAGIWSVVLGGLFNALAEARVPLFLHLDNFPPNALHAVCTDFPDLRVVLAGAGYGSDPWLYPLLRAHPNLHVCLGHFYIPSGNPMRFLQHFAVERLIFGSGLPEFSPGGLIGHVAYADIPDDGKAKILAGNIERLLGEVRL